MSRDEALAELARRYFRSRGPATLSDFSWWTGLSSGGAREAVELAREELASRTLDGATYWAVPGTRARRGSRVEVLPAFDEYLVGYRDRSAMVDPAHARTVNAGGGMLSPVVLVEGRPFARLAKRARDAIADAANRYAARVSIA